MQFISYDEYKGIGGTLDEAAFIRKITRVCGIVDNATHGRIEQLYGIPAQVKELCRDLVEYFAANENANGTVQSKSQSAGGVSESVSYASDDDIKNYIDNMIFDYLYNVRTKDGISVLYRGASV